MDHEVCILYLLVLARLLPLAMLVGNGFGTAVPRRWTLLIALILATVVAATQSLTPGTTDLSLVALTGAAFREFLVGLALGFGFAVLLAGLQVAGPLLSQLAGMGFRDAWDEANSALGANVLERYFTLLALSVFWVSGGHRRLVDAVLDSFLHLPVGALAPQLDPATVLGKLLTQSLQMGIRAAAPVAFCLLVSAGLLAILSRGMPYLGAFGMGLSINLVVLLLVSCVALRTMATTYQQQWAAGVGAVTEMMTSGGP